MPRVPLESIEWHDLPVTVLSLTERGISLGLTPWNETEGAYSSYTLRLTDVERLELSVGGTLSLGDLKCLEVSTFEYAVDDSGRLSGIIGILPGEAGYWTIAFAGAAWSLDPLNG